MAKNMRFSIFTNSLRDPDYSYTQKVAQTLLACGAEVYAESRLKSSLGIGSGDVEYYTYTEKMLENSDMIIVLGGDGSILKICEKAAEHDLPILGINLGHLGFLTALERDEISKLGEITAGNFRTEERMMAKATVRDVGVSYEFCALNDITVTSISRAKTGDFKILCNEAEIGFRADGVIISTPTGSTAYSLSAGGPVIDTSAELFCMTPICPHSLSSRPIVFSGNSVITVGGKTNGADSDIYVTSDGRDGVRVSKKGYVEIRRSPRKVKLVRMGKDGFFDILSKKMYGI